MKRIFKLLFLLPVLVQFTCTKEQVTSRPYPRVQTHSPSNLSSSGADFHGEITFTPVSLTDRGFLWSLNSTPTFQNSDSISLGPQQATGGFTTTIKRALIPGLIYYVRAYAVAGTLLIYGDIVSFLSYGSESPYSVTNIYPTKLMPRTIATVYGNFDDISEVRIGGVLVAAANITGIKHGQFFLKIPDLTKDRSTLTVVTSGQTATLKKKLSMRLSYRNQNVAGGSSATTSFSAGNKNYSGFGGGSSLSSYDPDLDTFVSINQSVISARSGAIGFSVNNIGYIAGGYTPITYFNDFYSIDPTDNTITKLADLPFTPALGFVINNKAYIISNYSKFYEFDPSTGLWAARADYPGEGGFYFYSPHYTFVQNGMGFVGVSTGIDYGGPLGEIWGFNPANNQWTKANNGEMGSYGLCGIVRNNGKNYLINPQFDYTDFTIHTEFLEIVSNENTLSFAHISFTTSLLFSPNGYFSAGESNFFLSGSSLWEFEPGL